MCRILRYTPSVADGATDDLEVDKEVHVASGTGYRAMFPVTPPGKEEFDAVVLADTDVTEMLPAASELMRR